MLQKIVSLLTLIDYAALNRFACEDVLLRFLAIKYVVVKGKKQDGAVKTKQEIKDKFSADNPVADLWMD